MPAPRLLRIVTPPLVQVDGILNTRALIPFLYERLLLCIKATAG
jgi:hypothetical protein